MCYDIILLVYFNYMMNHIMLSFINKIKSFPFFYVVSIIHSCITTFIMDFMTAETKLLNTQFRPEIASIFLHLSTNMFRILKIMFSDSISFLITYSHSITVRMTVANRLLRVLSIFRKCCVNCNKIKMMPCQKIN